MVHAALNSFLGYIESDFALAKLFAYISIGIIFLNIDKFKKIFRLNICVME